MGCVLPEDILSAGDLFRGDHIQGVVLVGVMDPRFYELLGEAGPQDLCPVKAQNGVGHSGDGDLDGQFFCRLDRFRQTVLGIGHVDVVIEMAVAGGKMAFCDAKGNVAVLTVKMDRRNDHGSILPF